MNASISEASTRISCGTGKIVLPDISWTNCLTDASKLNDAFTAMFFGSSDSTYTDSKLCHRLTRLRCSTMTPFGRPVEPDV